MVLVFIKSFHTAVFLFMSACILYILYAAFAQIRDWTVAAAVVVVSVETAVWWFAGRR